MVWTVCMKIVPNQHYVMFGRILRAYLDQGFFENTRDERDCKRFMRWYPENAREMMVAAVAEWRVLAFARKELPEKEQQALQKNTWFSSLVPPVCSCCRWCIWWAHFKDYLPAPPQSRRCRYFGMNDAPVQLSEREQERESQFRGFCLWNSTASYIDDIAGDAAVVNKLNAIRPYDCNGDEAHDERLKGPVVMA